MASAWTWAETSLSSFSRQAERLFSERLYGDAAPFYSEALSFAPDNEIKTQLTNRLAFCHLKEGKPQEALALLSPLTPLYKNQTLYFMSLAYRQLGDKQAALARLTHCTAGNDPQENDMIALEKGYHLFHLGDWTTARHAFSTILWKKNDPLPYALAQLHIAKIDLIGGKYAEALQTLDLLSQLLPLSHPLNAERTYLTGWLLLAMHDSAQAAVCFEELLPKAEMFNAEWSQAIRQGWIISLLNQALTPQSTKDQIVPLLSKAEEALNQLIKHVPTEASYVLLHDFYLIKAKTLNDPLAYVQAEQLLEKPDRLISDETLRQAKLKRAEAAPTYPERNRLYENLASDPGYPPSFCAQAAFLKGINAFNEGIKDKEERNSIHVSAPLADAARAFHKTADLTHSSDPRLSALALKYEALAYASQPDMHQAEEAWGILCKLLTDPALLSALDSPQEIDHLAGWVAMHLNDPVVRVKAKTFLREGQTGPSPEWSERCLKLEGLLSLQSEEWEAADACFSRLIGKYPASPSLGEIWFWRSYSADRLQNSTLKKEYLQQAYTQDPLNSYAPIAYFHIHAPRDYMQGSRKAIKHLQAMPLLFPSHPLLINAHYLIGLSQKKDHLSEEGQVVRRKDWTAAIEAFHLAESTFDSLYKKQRIPPNALAYYINIRARAQLERAQANFAIAKSSTGGKRQIYLEYAESVFSELIQNFKTKDSLVQRELAPESSPYPKVWAEAELKLAQLYRERDMPEKAEAVLNDALAHYERAKTTHSYGLMNVWVEKGKLALKQNDMKTALQSFMTAEKAAGDFASLSPHEKLDLWIIQSECCKSLNQLDPAMKLLSRVINDDVISPLRIKAMFLRAEIYEQQQRPELAIKQLEATARKGGEWAQKAQEKLEKTYGYK